MVSGLGSIPCHAVPLWQSLTQARLSFRAIQVLTVEDRCAGISTITKVRAIRSPSIDWNKDAQAIVVGTCIRYDVDDRRENGQAIWNNLPLLLARIGRDSNCLV